MQLDFMRCKLIVNSLSFQAGYVVAGFGAVGVVALFSMKTLLKFTNDAQLIIGGVIVMCVS